MPKTFLPLLILSLVVCCIEADISVPGFPQMATYFEVAEGTIQLTITYNFLGFFIAALIYGPLSEGYGRRPIMLIGNGLLLLGAVGCVASPCAFILLVFRFLQGLGAAASAVIVFAMIADAYPNQAQAMRSIGIMNTLFSTLMAIAPLIGGFINEVLGWQGNYGCVAVICLVSWVLLCLKLPETKPKKEPLHFRKISKDYQKLFSHPQFISASFAPSLLYSAYMSFITCSSFLYIKTFDLSVLAYVIHQGCIVSSFALVSFFSDKIIQKLGVKESVRLGISLCVLGMSILFLLSLSAFSSPYLISSFMMVFCIGFALCYPPVFAFSLEIFPEIKGTASSFIMSMRALLVVVFTGLTSSLYNGQPLRVFLVTLLVVGLSSIFMLLLLRSQLFSHSSPKRL